MLSSTLGFSIVVPILLAIGPLPPFTHVAALPSQVSEQNVHNDAALHAKRATAIISKPKLPKDFIWKCPGTTQNIRFAEFGREMPNFDDVISLIEKAEDELGKEWRPGTSDSMIKGERKWTFGTAVLTVHARSPDLTLFDHEFMLSWLKGLRLFGEVYGFWETVLHFRNGPFWLGIGFLTLGREPQRLRIDAQ